MIGVLLSNLHSPDSEGREVATMFISRLIDAGVPGYFQTFAEMSEDSITRTIQGLNVLFDCNYARVKSGDDASLGVATSAAAVMLLVGEGHQLSIQPLAESIFISLASLAVAIIDRVDSSPERYVRMLWAILARYSSIECFAREMGTARFLDLLVCSFRLGITILKRDDSIISRHALVEHIVTSAITVLLNLSVSCTQFEENFRSSHVMDSVIELFRIRPVASSARTLLMISSLSAESSQDIAKSDGILELIVSCTSKAAASMIKKSGILDYDSIHAFVSLTTNLLRTPHGLRSCKAFIEEIKVIGNFLVHFHSSIPDYLSFSILSHARLVATIFSANTDGDIRVEQMLVVLSRGSLESCDCSRDSLCLDLVRVQNTENAL